MMNEMQDAFEEQIAKWLKTKGTHEFMSNLLLGFRYVRHHWKGAVKINNQFEAVLWNS